MEEKRKVSKRTKFSAFLILLFIPLTIFIGIKYFNERKYMFISMLILFQVMIPFFMIFEDRKPQTRELIMIAGLTAVGVAGRVAFFWLPQFKPIIAVTMITAAALGPESGFLTGALIAFVSNFFFGQGPWTPWQMFATGIIGFVSGILFRFGILKNKRLPMAIFGFLITFFVYGFIMDFASLIMSRTVLTKETLLIFLSSGVPFNFVYGAATFVFLYFFGEEMREKIERTKVKYGLITEDEKLK